jgi:hypothetical protein
LKAGKKRVFPLKIARMKVTLSPLKVKQGRPSCRPQSQRISEQSGEKKPLH